MIVDRDRQHLLGTVLIDHVLIELHLDLARRGDVGEERLGHSPTPPLLVEDRLAELDALAANIDVARPFDERPDVAVTLAAERAIGVLLGATRGSRGRTTAVAFPTARRATTRDVLTRWHNASLSKRFSGSGPSGAARPGRLAHLDGRHR